MPFFSYSVNMLNCTGSQVGRARPARHPSPSRSAPMRPSLHRCHPMCRVVVSKATPGPLTQQVFEGKETPSLFLACPVRSGEDTYLPQVSTSAGAELRVPPRTSGCESLIPTAGLAGDADHAARCMEDVLCRWARSVILIKRSCHR